jgi:hypothetical protein
MYVLVSGSSRRCFCRCGDTDDDGVRYGDSKSTGVCSRKYWYSGVDASLQRLGLEFVTEGVGRGWSDPESEIGSENLEGDNSGVASSSSIMEEVVVDVGKRAD